MTQYAPTKLTLSALLIVLGLIFMTLNHRVAQDVSVQFVIYVCGIFLFLIGLFGFKEYDL